VTYTFGEHGRFETGAAWREQACALGKAGGCGGRAGSTCKTQTTDSGGRHKQGEAASVRHIRQKANRRAAVGATDIASRYSHSLRKYNQWPSQHYLHAIIRPGLCPCYMIV
jgi:hypothetical protein